MSYRKYAAKNDIYHSNTHHLPYSEFWNLNLDCIILSQIVIYWKRYLSIPSQLSDAVWILRLCPFLSFWLSCFFFLSFFLNVFLHCLNLNKLLGVKCSYISSLNRALRFLLKYDSQRQSMVSGFFSTLLPLYLKLTTVTVGNRRDFAYKHECYIIHLNQITFPVLIQTTERIQIVQMFWFCLWWPCYNVVSDYYV